MTLATMKYAVHNNNSSAIAYYGLLFNYIVFISYLGSLGVASTWAVIGFRVVKKFRKILLRLSIPAAGVVAGFVTIHYPNFIGVTDFSYGDVSVVFLISCVIVYQYTLVVASESLVAERNWIYNCYSILPSVSLAIGILIFSDNQNVTDVIRLWVFWWGFLCVVYDVAVTRASDDYQSIHEPESRRVEVFHSVFLVFLGSLLCQFALYTSNLILSRSQGGVLLATFVIFQQIRQAIIFIPSSISSVLAKRLVDERDNVIYSRKMLKIQYISAVGVGAFVFLFLLLYLLLLQLKYVSSPTSLGDIILYAAFTASASLIFVNNFFSRLAQAKNKFNLNFLFDISYALPALIILYVLSDSVSLKAVVGALVVGVISQTLCMHFFKNKLFK